MSRRLTGRSRRFVAASSNANAVDISSNLFARYNFAAANVTKDGSNNISQVNDLSGNARHITQGTGANQPLWVSAGLNGQDYGRFNTAGPALKRLTRSIVGDLTELAITIAIVHKIDTLGALNATINLHMDANSSTGRGGYTLEYFSNTGTRRLRFINSAGVSSSTTFGNVSTGTWEIIVVAAEASADDGAATIAADVNGSSASLTGTSNYSTIDGTPHLFQMGTSSTSGTPDFSIAEMWLFRGRALNSASRLQLARDLGTTYGITVA